MKKSILIFVILFFVTGCTTQTLVKQNTYKELRQYETEELIGPKKKVAVTLFTNETRFGKRRLGQNVSNILATELDKTDRFVLLERNRIEELMKQIALSQSGLTKGKLQNARLLDTDYIITGAVTKYSVSIHGNKNVFTQSKTQIAHVAVDVRIIDVRTGKIILSESGEGQATKQYSQVLGMGASGSYDESLEGNAFRASVIKLMENIITTLDGREWLCNVVKISGKKLYLDAGKKSNLNIGTKLEIYQLGERITDLSGMIIGHEETLLGEIIVDNYLGENGSIAYYKGQKQLALPIVCHLPQN